MIAHIQGQFIQVTPAYVVVDCHGVGYCLHISLYTFEKFKDQKNGLLFSHLSIKEDGHTLYGFVDEAERNLFRQLILVNGVGANTARMMLSSLNPGELYNAIVNGNVGLLKSIKGIGEKTAQRIVIDLQSKLSKEGLNGEHSMPATPGNANQRMAMEALVTLGFNRVAVEKTLTKLNLQNQNTEDIIKQALKVL